MGGRAGGNGSIWERREGRRLIEICSRFYWDKPAYLAGRIWYVRRRGCAEYSTMAKLRDAITQQDRLGRTRQENVQR